MKKSFFVIIVLICFAASCSNEKKEGFALKGDDQIAAEVGGESISFFDVEETARKTLGEERASSIDVGVKKKILESLVTSRAMAQAQWKSMSDEEKVRTIKDVAAYREQLLVRKYLAENASPAPITEEKMKAWYEAHPEMYGAKETIHYEMVAGDTKGQSRSSESWVKQMGDVAASSNWSNYVTSKREEGWPLFYRDGHAREEVMDKTLFTLIKSVAEGETSPLTYIKGNPYLVRVIKKSVSDPKPFEEVRAEIRQSLGPLRMKEAVRSAGVKALANVDVVYK